MTAEWGGVTRGGIGEVVRAEVARDPGRALVLIDGTHSTVERVRRSAPEGARVESVAELAWEALPRRVFRSRAYWRSHSCWLALRSIVAQCEIESIEFPDFDGPGFVSVKSRRLGIGPSLPPISVRLHGTVARIAQADDRSLLGIEDKQRASMECYALAHADRIIAPSEAVLAEYRAVQPLATEASIAPPRFVVPEVAAPPVATAPPLRVGFLGKLQPLKGPETLVRAAVRVMQERGEDALELIFVGGDEAGRFLATHREELRRLVPPEYAARVHFEGALPRETALRRMATCHAAVVPSRTETFGLAARELATLGLPLAISDLPAFADVEAGDGGASIERFPVDDVDALGDLLDGWCARVETEDWPPPRTPIATRNVSPATSGRARPATECTSELISTDPAGPLVSVVVPYYEMPEYLDACLKSVVAAPYARKEIVVVDDGTRSTEGRAELDRISEAFEDCALRVVRKENGGLASARNAGVAAAAGDYVLPLDPDDLIEPGYLGAAVAVLETHPELCWVNGISASFAEGDDRMRATDWIVPYDPDPGMLFYENGCGTAAAVFRRETLTAFPYREDLPAYEDWDLQLRLALEGIRGEGLPEIFHRYRQRRGGLARVAHLRHPELVARVVAPRLAALPSEIRSAFEVYLSSVSHLRGLGGVRRGLRGALYIRLALIYRNLLKDLLGRVVGEVTRDRWVQAVRRRWVGGSAELPRGR